MNLNLNKIKLIFFIIFNLLFLISAQENSDKIPSWLLISRGKHLIEEGRIGSALELFLQAKDTNERYPEAEYWIGRSYEADNSLDLAEMQYKKAEQLSNYLYNKDMFYQIKYSLADIALKKAEYRNYELILTDIIYREVYPSEVQLQREENIIRILRNQDIDNLVFFNRFHLQFSANAFRKLARYNYDNADYKEAMLNAIYPILSSLSFGIDYMRQYDVRLEFPQDALENLLRKDPKYLFLKIRSDLQAKGIDYRIPWSADGFTILNPKENIQIALNTMQTIIPDYEFTGLAYIIEKLNDYPQAFDNNFYEMLYLLASTLALQGYDEQARRIWLIIDFANSDEVEWQEKSRAQLIEPFIDVFILH